MRRLAVFVGPQGAGKSTIAAILCRLHGCRVVKAIPYTLLHIHALRLASALAEALGVAVRVKFYEDEPPSPSAPPRLIKALIPLLLLAHLAGLALDELWLRLKSLAGGGLIIEDEGYAYKQAADLSFLLRAAGAPLPRLFLRLSYGIARRDAWRIIYFKPPGYAELRERYIRQKRLGEARRKIEPPSYTAFQQALYEALGADCVVATDDLKRAVEDAASCLFQFYSRSTDPRRGPRGSPTSRPV